MDNSFMFIFQDDNYEVVLRKLDSVDGLRNMKNDREKKAKEKCSQVLLRFSQKADAFSKHPHDL